MSGSANHFTPDWGLNEGQFKASFVKKFKLKDGSATIVHDTAAPPGEASLPLYIFMIICKSPLLFHRREGQGEQSSLACKEICTETSCCVLLHTHRDQFKITINNHTNLWTLGI